MLNRKYITIKDTPKRIEEPVANILWSQGHLIEETEILIGCCYDPAMADRINFDAFQAICFLVVADQHVDLGKGELQDCLDLLGVHPVVLMDTVRILKKSYRIPKNAGLLSFIQYIGPIMLAKNELVEYE